MQEELKQFADAIGKTKKEAQRYFEDKGFSIMRIVEEDGEGFFFTLELRNDRINVTVTDGKISEINFLG